MIREISKRLISMLCATALLLGLLPAVPGLLLQAEAALNGQLNDTNIVVTEGESGGSWSVSGTSINGSATGTTTGGGCSSSDNASTGSVTIKNNSQYNGTLSFTYDFTADGGSAVIDGTTRNADGSWDYSRQLAPGGSITVSITSGEGEDRTSTLVLNNIVLALDRDVTVTFLPGEGGNYTVDGEPVTEEKTVTFNAADGIALAASPNEGYLFTSWMDADTGAVYSTQANLRFSPAENCRVYPVFITQRDAAFQVNGVDYYTWEDAFRAAGSGGTVVLTGDYVMPATLEDNGLKKNGTYVTADSDGNLTYRIGEGQQLLLPYAQGANMITGSGDKYPYANYTLTTANANALKMDPSYRNVLMTVPQGIKLSVGSNAKLVVGGQISSSPKVSGGTTEKYAQIQLDGQMDLDSGSILSACGYITGSGRVQTVGSNAQLYQPMVICDFRGGGYTVGAAGSSFAMDMQSGEEYTTPFLRYTVQNIQSDLSMDAGNYMYGYCDLYANSSHNQTNAALIGDSSKEGLIMLNAGAVLESSYNADQFAADYPDVGKTSVRITGGGSYGNMTLEVSLSFVSASINTSELTFPVPYNYDFILEDGNYDIVYSMALLPGSSMVVGEDATLNIGSPSVSSFRFMVYDGLYDHTSTGSSSADVTVAYGQTTTTQYPKTDDLQGASFAGSGTANLVVNGTLNILSGVSFGGVVQTEGTGTLVMDAGATPSCTTQAGLVGSKRILINNYRFAGATVRTLEAQVLDTGTGQRLDIVAGKTYHGSGGSSVLQEYTYDLYTSSSSTSQKETHTEILNAMVGGSWWNYTATVHMVDPSSGEILSSNPAYFAHGADVSGYFLDAACSQPAGTVTGDGMVLYSNDLEARVDWAAGGSPAYYPSLATAVKDAVHAGDTVVALREIVVDQPVPIDAAQDLTIDLNGYGISYSATPFVNGGTVRVLVKGADIQNDGSAAAPAVSNQASGNMTMELGGGTIRVTVPGTGVESFAAVTNSGVLDLDLGGGSVICDYPAVIQAGSQAILNTGELTLRSTGAQGSVTSNTGRASTTVNSKGETVNATLFSATTATPTETLAAVVRNSVAGAELTVDNVLLSQTSSIKQNVSGTNVLTSAGIVNFNGGRVLSLTNAAAAAPGGYAIFNVGAEIDLIQGGSYEGYYGVYSRNIRVGSQTTTGFAIHRQSTIDTIDGPSITASNNYGIYNGAVIHAITGGTQVRAAAYAIYNHNGWYYDSMVPTYVDDTPNMKRTYYYDLENLPTIDRIDGNVTVTATGNYGLINYGKIGEIGGNSSFTAANYAISMNDGGWLGALTGNVTATATSSYAVNLTGQRTESYYVIYEGTAESPNAIGGTGLVTSYTYGSPSRIERIEGDMAGAGITLKAGGNYAIRTSGYIGSIQGKVDMQAAQNTLDLNTGAAFSSQVYTRTFGTKYDTGSEQTREYNYVRNIDEGSYIGAVGGAGSQVSITATNYYAIMCGGYIEELGPGVTVSLTQGQTWNSAIYISDGRQMAYDEIRTNLGTGGDGRCITRFDYTYEYDAGSYPATIAKIDGITVNDPKYYAVRNSGYIGELKDTSITADRYALQNYASGPYNGTRQTQRYYAGSAIFSTTTALISEINLSYERSPARIDRIDGCSFITTGAGYGLSNGGSIGAIVNTEIATQTERAVSNAESRQVKYRLDGPDGGPVLVLDTSAVTCVLDPGRVATYNYDRPVIETIGGGNTFTSTTNTVINSGILQAVDNTDGGEGTLPVSTVAATNGVAFFNYRGTIDTRTTTYDEDNTAVNQDTYISAQIGTVKNVQLTGTSYGIQNGDGNTAYPNLVIDELADGVIATATGSTGYGVRSSTNAAITLISGGHYKGAAETGNRAYAIHNADTQTYPAGYSLSGAGVTESVELADGQTARLYYFITNGVPVAQIISGSASKWYLTLAAAVADYDAGSQGEAENDAGLPYIQMAADITEPGFTISKPVYLNLNGCTVTLTGAEDAVGTLTIASGGALYGMDSTTNNYEDKAYGKIFGKVTFQNGGSLATAHETFRNGDGETRYRYVTLNDTGKNELSFHRYNMSVTKYEFHFRPSGQCDMDFGATFRGSSTVVRLLEDMGFKVEKTGTPDPAQGWWSTQNGDLPADLASGYILRGTLINIGADNPKEFTEDYKIYALLKFQDDQDGTVVDSVPRPMSYLWALKQYYNSDATDPEKEIIGEFLDKNSLWDVWNSIQ